jgi:hypothetical protein
MSIFREQSPMEYGKKRYNISKQFGIYVAEGGREK